MTAWSGHQVGNNNLMWAQISESQNQDSLKCSWNAKWKRCSGGSEWTNKMLKEAASQHTQHAEDIILSIASLI